MKWEGGCGCSGVWVLGKPKNLSTRVTRTISCFGEDAFHWLNSFKIPNRSVV